MLKGKDLNTLFRTNDFEDDEIYMFYHETDGQFITKTSLITREEWLKRMNLNEESE